MSAPGTCPACMLGEHEKHDHDYGIKPGLIGGQFCPCAGNCAEVFRQQAERLRQMLEAKP